MHACAHAFMQAQSMKHEAATTNSSKAHKHANAHARTPAYARSTCADRHAHMHTAKHAHVQTCTLMHMYGDFKPPLFRLQPHRRHARPCQCSVQHHRRALVPPRNMQRQVGLWPHITSSRAVAGGLRCRLQQFSLGTHNSD